jgi:TolA-binding protein
MLERLAPALVSLFLATATATAGAAAPSPGHASARGDHAPQAAIEQLQQAVSAAEARRQEIQRRLSERDREIQVLRRQLQGAGYHESTRLH